MMLGKLQLHVEVIIVLLPRFQKGRVLERSRVPPGSTLTNNTIGHHYDSFINLLSHVPGLYNESKIG
jgi:hypothetical protein